jgi:hypothetical protein
MFEEVTKALETKAAAPAPEPEASPRSAAVAELPESAPVLDTGSTLSRQAGLLVAGLLALWLISWLFGRRRSGS